MEAIDFHSCPTTATGGFHYGPTGEYYKQSYNVYNVKSLVTSRGTKHFIISYLLFITTVLLCQTCVIFSIHIILIGFIGVIVLAWIFIEIMFFLMFFFEKYNP